MNLSFPGVREIWLKFKKQTKEPNKEQSRAAKEKLAMEFNMNIIFSNNVSNNNAEVCFKLHKYTEVCFFYLHDYGKLPPWSLVLQFAFQFRCSNFAWVHILSLRSFLEDFVFSTTDLTDVLQYVTRMWKDIWSNSPQR